MSILDILNADFASVPVTSVDGLKMNPDWSKMNEATLAHLVWHGLKQKMNDPNGAKGLTDLEKEGNSRKVLDNMEANEVRSAVREADPVQAELMRRVVALVSTAILNKGLKLKDYKMADLRKRGEEYLAKFPEKAEAMRSSVVADLAARKELASDIEI